MDYKMFFKKAFSDIRKEHSCPDDETVVNNILERAKTMNNNNENERTYNTQAYEVQPTPTKGHKALSVVACIAGTAAVLAGAVFGLNWLNEHGGLTEGGIESSNGAGYHGDVTEPAQSAAETTNALIATEDIRYDTETPENVFEFDGVRAIVDWWQFDGKTLKLQYDIDFGTKRCEDIVNDFSPRITPMGDFEASTTLDVFEQKENSIKMRATIELFHYADNVSLNFLDNDEYVRMKQGEIEMMSPDAYRELEISLINFKKLAVHYTYSKDTDAFDDMAIQYYKEAMDADPEIPDAFFNAGYYYLKKRNFADARGAFESFLALCADTPDEEMGENGIEKKHAAQEQITKIKNRNLENEHFHNAYDLITRGEEEKGIDEIRRFLQENPAVWNAWFMLGWGLRRLGRFGDAKKAFEKARECEGGDENADTLNELAICQMETGELDEARNTLVEALEMDPDSTKIISNLGFLSLKCGNEAEARKFFMTVLEIDPEDPIAKTELKELSAEV